MVSFPQPPFNVILEGGKYTKGSYKSLYKLAHLPQLDGLLENQKSVPLRLQDGDTEFTIVYDNIRIDPECRSDEVLSLFIPLIESQGIVVGSEGKSSSHFSRVRAVFTLDNLLYVNADMKDYHQYIYDTLEEIRPEIMHLFLHPTFHKIYSKALLNK